MRQALAGRRDLLPSPVPPRSEPAARAPTAATPTGALTLCFVVQYLSIPHKNQPTCANVHQKQNPHFQRVMLMALDLQDYLFLILSLARLPVPPLQQCGEKVTTLRG